MKNIPYAVTVLVLFLVVFLALLAPILAFDNSPLAGILYNDIFSYTCHQKISRSLCVFNGASGYFIADCTGQLGKYTEDSRAQISAVDRQGFVGYKMAYCARDFGIYFAALAGLVICPFVLKLENKTPPPGIYLLLALLPIGIDGTLQLLSTLGILLPFIGFYESTNFMRLFTGLLAGFVAAFYIPPMLCSFFSPTANKANSKVK